MAAPPSSVQDVAMEDSKHASNEQNIHTPPASDMSSHGRKGDDDDAASSSELSDLDDQFDGAPQPSFAQDVPMQDAPAVVEPDRYEGGIPIFQPTMEQFQDFEQYMNAVNPYGMKSGIVLIDPPEEWKAARKPLDNMVKNIKVRNPITQEFHHNEYGIYTQRNMEKMRSYNLPQWKALCEQSQYQPPARRGERRNKAGTQPGAKIVPLKRKSEPLPLPEGVKRKAGRPRVRPLKEEKVEEDVESLAPPTPTSPGTIPAEPFKSEDHETPDPTPTKRRGRPPRGGGPSKPGRQPKAVTKKVVEKGSGEKATTVAARRLHNEADAMADDVNEEDFKDFDYRIHNHEEWTRERCEELEEKYWKSLSYTNPMYGADMPGSLFDDETTSWNVAKLPNLLDILGSKIPGVNTAYLYLGMWRATFAWHLEDVDLYSINYIHFGAPKQWYSISQADAPKFEKAMRSIYANEAKNCDQFLRHKTFLVSPSLLKNKYGVTVNRVVHREGQFVVTFPIGYHSGYNLGYNCAESVNFALKSWLPYGKNAKKCRCEDDSVFIDVDWFIRRLNGEPTPEIEEWVEVTDDEDDLDGPTDLPTPPGSDRGQVKPAKRKRQSTKDGGGKKMKRIKIKISKSATPCCLCPNDFACDDLLPTDDNRKAHRRCALYTPETYFDEVDGKELIRGMAEIAKARMDLRCNECRQKRGSCFQCSSAKCARAYHATCAAQAGVQVDIGDIAIWIQDVEYRDTGLDFRCKMHRSVKTAKPSSDLAKDNYRHIEKDTKEFHTYLTRLKQNDIVQYQISSADDIEAGVLVEPFDEDEGVLVVDLLPTHRRRLIEASTVLFVDAATSCLQKPSANAKEIPKQLRGKACSMEDPSNRKPSRLDLFCDGHDSSKPYLWEEFASATPAVNKDQKAVDLSKDRRLWYYLGKPSTESKAQYTGDAAKPVNDPASNFLQSVEPAKRPLIPQSQPIRRQSLPASYPVQTPAGVQVPQTNAAMVTPRLPQAERLEQQKIEDYQRRMAILGSSASPVSPSQYHNSHRAANNQSPLFIHPGQGENRMSQLPPDLAAQDAMLAKQRAILERSQQRALVLDQQDRPYNYKPRSSIPPPNIGIDTQSIERQREFQRRAYQQSLNTQLSPHSPGTHPGFTTNGHMSQWDEYGVPERGLGYVSSQDSANTARYGNASPSPTEAAFPLLRRPHQQPISSPPSDPQHNDYQLHPQSISSQQQAPSVNFFNNQRRLSQPNNSPQPFSHQTQISPSSRHFSMSSPGRTAPIDIPQQRSNMSATMRNRGQHTANFIDPNLMQISPNQQTYPVPPGMSQGANKTSDAAQARAKVDQATRSMPPPPIPSQTSSSSSTAHSSVTATADISPYSAAVGYMSGQGKPSSRQRSITFAEPKLTDILSAMQQKELEHAQKTLISDKPVPQSVAAMRLMADDCKKVPSAYATPYNYGYNLSGVRVTASEMGKEKKGKEGMVSYGGGLASKVVEDEDGDEWVDVVKKDKGKSKDVTVVGGAGPVAKKEDPPLLDSEWVRVDIQRREIGVGAASRGVSGGRAALTIDPAAGLANSFYAGRSVAEKKKIEDEARRMGWFVGEEE